MKQNHHQVARQSSRHSAAPQPKTAHSRAGHRPASPSPSVALFPEGDGAGGGNGGVSEEIIDLSKAEYAALKRAAAPSGDGILMFMANAALEKAARPGGTVTCILILPNGSEVARLDFPRNVFARIETVAAKLGITLQQFFEKAIRNYIRSQSIRRAA
jgi:hypothetical protein